MTMTHDLRQNIVRKILLLREYKRIKPKVFDFVRPIRRDTGENDFKYNYRLQTTAFNIEELLADSLSLHQKVMAYENLFRRLDAPLNFGTQDKQLIADVFQLIADWNRALRVGNGELRHWENKKLRNDVIRKMGKLRNE